jgi:hypothetical protein
MLGREVRVTIDVTDSTCRFHGVDYGPHLPVVVAWTGRMTNESYLTVKVDGGKYWSGLGQQSYAPAQFLTFLVTGQEAAQDQPVVHDGKVHLYVKQVIDHPIRAKALDLTHLAKKEG